MNSKLRLTSLKDTINAKKLFCLKKMLFLFNFGGDLIWRILMKSVHLRDWVIFQECLESLSNNHQNH